MQILQCLSNLHNDVPRKLLAKVRQTNDLVKEFASGTKFEDDIVILPALGEVDESNNVWMVKLSHDLNLLQDIRTL
jgi:hypothetical protein